MCSCCSTAITCFHGTGKPGVLRTVEGVEVTLVKGAIAGLQVNVIVNTISKDLNLSHGAVSKSILTAAGPQIQDECKKNAPPSFTFGDIIETKAYQLKADYVFHGACTAWDNHAGRCEQVVRTLLQNILRLASAKKLGSLAMPAIGTGNLRIPPAFVASVMYDELMKFSQTHAGTTLKDVRIVVYDQDHPTISAFESKIKELLAGAPPFVSPTPSGAAANANPSGSPSQGAAPRSLAGPMSLDTNTKTLSVGPIRMTIVQGDITTSSTDAIVNSTDDRMSMNGEVGKALLRAGGDVFKKACTQARMGPNRLCVTNGGNMPAKNVVHLSAASSSALWKAAIGNCLMEAESRKWSSITFPVLGTGNRSMSTPAAADMMVESVEEFAATIPVHVKCITVCIFQKAMVDEYMAAVAKKVSPGLLQKFTATMSTAVSWLKGTSRPAESTEEASEQAESGRGGAPATARFVGGSVEQHPRCIVVHIYATHQSNIDAVIKSVDDMIRDYFIDYVLDDAKDQQLIAQLSAEQIKQITDFGLELQTSVTVEQGQKINRIRITGPPKRFTEVSEKVRSVLNEKENHRQQMLIASQAQWEFIDNGSFEPYPDEINAIIENAFRDNKKCAEWEEQDARFRVTFAKMIEETVDKQLPTVQVRRVTIGVDLPSNWTAMGTNENVKLVTLDPNSTEYKDVQQDVNSSANNTVKQITKIERVQNPLLYKQYVLRKLEMDRANPAQQNERKLWHGTAADTLKSINETGFNRSYCGKNATLYGRGVYFAHDFAYSANPTYSPPDANGDRYIYQSLVLTGEFTVGSSSMLVPPNKTTSSGRYDSTVNNQSQPSIFVVYNDSQAYPLYVVTFK